MFLTVCTMPYLAVVVLASVTRLTSVVCQCVNCGDGGDVDEAKFATVFHLVEVIPRLEADVEQLQRQLNESTEQRQQLQQQLANWTEQLLEHMRREHERTRDIREEMKQQWTVAQSHVKAEQERKKYRAEEFQTKQTVKDLMAAAQPVDGESWAEKRARILRVMGTLRKFGQSELCSLVADDIVKDGELNLDRSVKSENLDDLIYFLSSPAATAITDLRLADNVVFAGVDAVRSLAATMTSLKLPQLRRLDLNRCRLTNDGLRAVVEAVFMGCQHLMYFGCWDRSRYRQLTEASEATVRLILTRRSRLSINLWFRSPLLWMRRLKDEFHDRVG